MGSSLAQWSTKSQPLPVARSSSTIALALALIESSMRRTWRGLGAACASLRNLVCRGGSIARDDCDASSSSAGMLSNITPCPDRKTSLLRLTVTISARRVTAQKPGPVGSGSNKSSTGGCQPTGRSARSTANERSRSAAVPDQNARDDRSISS